MPFIGYTREGRWGDVRPVERILFLGNPLHTVKIISQFKHGKSSSENPLGKDFHFGFDRHWYILS
jgi:hypothetical protein